MHRSTASAVAERLEEAAATLRRLPSVRAKGYFSSVSPDILHDFEDRQNWEAKISTTRPSQRPDNKRNGKNACVASLVDSAGKTLGVVASRPQGLERRMLVHGIYQNDGMEVFGVCVVQTCFSFNRERVRARNFVINNLKSI